MSSVSSKEKRSSGCGLLGAVFGGRKKFWLRRSTSTGSIPRHDVGNINNVPKRIPSAGSAKKRRGSSNELEGSSNSNSNSNSNGNKPQPKVPPVRHQQNQHQRQQQNHVRRPNSSDTTVAPASSRTPALVQNQNQCNDQSYVNNSRKTVPKESMGLSGELEMMISENRGKGGDNLVRVSSGNVMVQKSLGNLRQPGGTTYTYTKPTTNGKDENRTTNNVNNASKYLNSGMGNIVNKKQMENGGKVSTGGTSLCRALSCRMDPEELKIMGNEDYKNGNFAEALALYERAIDLDPSKASYRSNKSAALTALGRLLEAVFECREAIGLEPQYQRAHHRLANLYLRLGEADKATYHFKHAGPEADPDAMCQTKVVLGHLKKCEEAKRLKDWHTVLRESGNAIAAGADSAPMIFALQAEAYLKLHRPQDAVTTLTNGPAFDVDQCTKFFGPVSNAMLLVIRAQVDMAAGRFEDAMEAIKLAGKLDASNREVGIVARRARAVSAARSNGNDLFKEGRFSEACVAYGQGLEHDPNNSVLLSNRAACRVKLGQFDKAIEDCTATLNSCPSYTKARLRRADCNVKLQKWETALRDYQILLQESPGDEDMAKAYFEAQAQLKKQRGEDVSNMKLGNDGVVKAQSSEHFRNVTSWPGLSVVFFCNKSGDRRTLHFMEQLCNRYPTIKFLKVEVEDCQSLVKSEGVCTLPAFKIYRNGSSVDEISGEDHDSLENSIKEHTS